MDLTSHERPGVYSVYDASTVVDGSGGKKIVGLAAKCTSGEAGTVSMLTRGDEAGTCFGEGTAMAGLVKLLLQNGAAAVAAAPVIQEGDYAKAFTALEAVEGLALVMCDTEELSVQQALRDSVKAASGARKERVGVVCGGSGETVSQLVTRAQALNCERLVLVAPEADEGPAASAAAVAGVLAGESDPAVPLGGAVLKGLSGLKALYGDGEIDLLVRGGVTPLESIAGEISVVRGVTTRTKNGDASDTTWRELSTILIVDDVIPAVRNSLRAKFQRAKNTEQSRGAIRAQVMMELENRMSREIITGYDGVTVKAMEENPTVCLVSFAFTVAHGLNQIWLTAHITV